MKRKFISAGYEWSNGLINITRKGVELDTETDATLIESIIRDGVMQGGLVVEIPTANAIKESNAALLKAILSPAEPEIKPPEVEPLSLPDIDEELQEVERQNTIKAEQAKAEAEAEAARKAEKEKKKEEYAEKKQQIQKKKTTSKSKPKAKK